MKHGLLAAMLAVGIGCAACAPGSPSTVGGRCAAAPPPVTGTSGGLAGIGPGVDSAVGGSESAGIQELSAAAGTRQAWAIAGTHIVFGSTYLLRFTGLTWTKVATFGSRTELNGVSAASGSAAWVWGMVRTRSGYPGHPMPFVALVSGGGTVRPMLVPSRWRYVWPLTVVSHGPDNAWLSGFATDRRGRRQGPVLARWDGSSWWQVREPGGYTDVTPVSAPAPSSLWAFGTHGSTLTLLHWNGALWSRSYRRPARAYRAGWTHQAMTAAASTGLAWVIYYDERFGPHDNPGPTRSFSASYDGRTWHQVAVPRALTPMTHVTVSGPDA